MTFNIMIITIYDLLDVSTVLGYLQIRCAYNVMGFRFRVLYLNNNCRRDSLLTGSCYLLGVFLVVNTVSRIRYLVTALLLLQLVDLAC
jgi:acetoacetate decarboxylase